jgi:hypothetical protein
MMDIIDIIDNKTSRLLDLITIIPDKFEDVLILESDEIDNFDIGFIDFYLICKKDIYLNKSGFNSLKEIIEKIRHKYSISIDQPRARAGESVYFFKRTIISKPINLRGEIDLNPSLSYNERIKSVLIKNSG